MQQKAIIAAIVGIASGCFVSAMIDARHQNQDSSEPYVLSVNQRTGRPELHVKGQPDIQQ